MKMNKLPLVVLLAALALSLCPVTADAQGSVLYTSDPINTKGLKWQGIYAGAGTPYGVNDMVLGSSGSYVSLVPNNTAPLTNTAAWAPVSLIGVFGASGVSHASGAVPDPGATSGTSRYLREDGSWIIPPTSVGLQGPAGPVGPQGLIGLTGPTGPAGVTGPAGPQGLTGPSGATGSTGPAGANGTNGTNGASITPPVAYSAGTTYSQYQLATSNSIVYQYTSSTPSSGNAPSGTTAANAYWTPFAEQAAGTSPVLGSGGSILSTFAAGNAGAPTNDPTKPTCFDSAGNVRNDSTCVLPFDGSGAATAAQNASLQKSSNLSDVASAATARANLGLGTAATTAATAYDPSGAAASRLSLAPSLAQYVVQPATVAGSAETFTGLTQTTGVIGNPWATYAGADMRSPMYQISTAGIYTGGYHAYGDSITAGQLATVSANRWVNIVAAATGATLTNYAVGGNFAEDDVNAIFNNENPGASAATLYTYADGINNKSRGLGTVVEQQYTDALTAGATRLSTPSTLVSLPSTTPTNWTVGTQYAANPGICSTTNGATFTQSLTTTAFGQAIFIWYAKNDASGGSFRWQTDDGQSGTASSNYLPNLINTPNGSTASVAAIIESNIARVAASSHSVQITVTSATNAANPVCILGVGVSPPAGSITAVSPMPWLEGVKREAGPNNSEQEAQLTGRYNWLSSQVAANLDTQGWPVNWVNSRNFFSSTDGYDINYSSTNNKHPNNIGHAEIAAAYLAPTYMPRFSTGQEWETSTVNYNGVTATVGNTAVTTVGLYGAFNPNSSFTLSCSQQYGTSSQSSAIVITLPTTCYQGVISFIANNGTGNITFTGATGGNANNCILYPGSSVLIGTYLLSTTVTTGSWNVLSGCTQAATFKTLASSLNYNVISTVSGSVATAAFGAAAAGHFSVPAGASGGTIVINSTAITATSEVSIEPVTATSIGTLLAVTCATPTAGPVVTGPIAQAAGSVTFNAATFTGTACYQLKMVNN